MARRREKWIRRGAEWGEWEQRVEEQILWRQEESWIIWALLKLGAAKSLWEASHLPEHRGSLLGEKSENIQEAENGSPQNHPWK